MLYKTQRIQQQSVTKEKSNNNDYDNEQYVDIVYDAYIKRGAKFIFEHILIKLLLINLIIYFDVRTKCKLCNGIYNGMVDCFIIVVPCCVTKMSTKHNPNLCIVFVTGSQWKN